MIAAVIREPGVIGIEEARDPQADGADVVIRVAACGICGTDLHLADGDLPYRPYPVIPGHEFYGDVVDVGPEVAVLRRGDVVAVDPNLPCGRCSFCQVGRANLCENYRAVGVTRDGGCAQFVGVPETACYRLPEDFDLAVAALIEPASCAVHAFDRLPRSPGDRYLIYGAGPMGLLMAGLAAQYSNRPADVVDLNPDRLRLARELGHRAAGSADEFDQGGWHTVIDCSGAVPAVEDALRRVRSGGTLQLFGVAAAAATARFAPFDIYRREITIIGTMAVHNSFGRAVEYVRGAADWVSRLISHRYPLADYGDAVTRFRTGQSYKILVEPNTRLAAADVN